MVLTLLRLTFITLFFGYFVATSYLTITAPTTSTSEQRRLADFPAPVKSYGDAQRFFQEMESWAQDRMHYRQQFITLLNLARYRLGYTQISGTLIGKENWLFYNATSREHEDARASNQFTPEELQHWKDYLLYRNNNARKMGSVFIFLMIPNKSTVYAEYLPDNYTRLSNTTRMQQIVDAMQGTGVIVLDARSIQEEAKQHGQAYLKAGSHWNLLGGNYGQYLVMQELAKHFPDFKPRLYPFHEASVVERMQLDLTVDLYNQMALPLMEDEPHVPIVDGLGDCVGKNDPENLRLWPAALGDCSRLTTAANDPEWHHLVMDRWGYLSEPLRKYLFQSTINPHGKHSLLMMKDSFNEMLQPFFSNQFRQARYIGLSRPVDMTSWSWIEALHPDVIIEEMIERGLKDTVPRPGLDYPAT